MSRRKSIRSRKYYSVTVSAVLGIATSVIVFMLCALIISTADIPYAVIIFMSNLSIASGGFAAGYSFGKKKRRGGIKCGAVCAFILLVIFISLSLLITGRIAFMSTLKKSFVLTLCSVSGGILGVNTKIKKPPI